jgi:drug/metabolite transporter (DMT)-like permease
MDILLILACCCLATLKVGIQSKASRTVLTEKNEVVFYNFGVFGLIAILFLYSVFGCSFEVWVYGAMFAFLTVNFQLFYTEALASGSVSLTVMMVNLAMVIPVLFSKFCYNEPLTTCRIIGILLTIVSIVCVTDLKSKKHTNKKWLLCAVVATLVNGLTGIVQKSFNASPVGVERSAFISTSYIMAFIFSGLVLLVMSLSKGKAKRLEPKKIVKILPYIIAVGITLGTFQMLYNYTMTLVDGTYFFPVYSGGAIVLSTLLGVIMFKDKISKNQVVGIILGIASIVLMNF